MLNFAKNNQDIDLVFSPHPALVTIMRNMGDEKIKKEFDDFIAEWNELKNTSYSIFSTYSSMFRAADLLIVDGISWLLEFQLEHKPIIFLERDEHLPFNESGIHISKGVNAIKDIELALDLIIQFKNGKIDSKKKYQEDNCKEFLTIDGYESIPENIVASVYHNLTSDRN